MKSLVYLFLGIFAGIILERKTGIYDYLGLEDEDATESEDNYDQIKADARTGLQ
ncbi:hypothetical protein BH23BAC1_BH23BAC1_47870 [soil metagenome]